MENPLDLNDAELDAIRGLQAGMTRVGADDPVWEGLEELGLVDCARRSDPQAHTARRALPHRLTSAPSSALR